MGSLTSKVASFKTPPTPSTASPDRALPCRTENWKPEPGAEYKYLVIQPDIFPGEDIVVVLKPEYLAEAEKENPGLVTYLLSEIDALIPHEHDIAFRKKVHLAKKTFGGTVRPVEREVLKV